MRIKKLALTLCLVGAGLALSVGTAAAGTVVLYSPATQINDQNLDFVNDIGVGNAHVLGVGDELISVFQFSQTIGFLSGQNAAPLGADNGNPGTTLVGVADVTIVAVLPDGTLVFAPTNSALVGGAGMNLLGSLAQGTAVAMYQNSTLDTTLTNDVFNSHCGTRAQCLALATDGQLWLTAGFFGDPDESWTSNPLAGGQIIATVQNGNAQTTFGIFNYELSIGVNNTGYLMMPTVSCAPFCGPGGNGFVQISGNGQINGGGAGVGGVPPLNPADWTARSKTGAMIAPQAIPEPATLTLLGLGLLGLGGLRLRRKH